MPRDAPGSPAYLAQTYHFQKTPPGPPIEETVLDYWTEITTVSWKQTPPLQGDPETHLGLWNTTVGTASNSNIDILERFQAKLLSIIIGAPWYVPNAIINRDLRVSTVKHAARTYSITYHGQLVNHPNRVTPSLVRGLSYPRRFKRKHPQDLQT